MPNAFGLNNSGDLCRKLGWEIDQLRNCPPGPGSPVSYLAFNCAVTAWHIADWVWHDLSEMQKAELSRNAPLDLDLSIQGHFERLVRRKSEDLRICYVIAQRVKHHTLKPNVDDHEIHFDVSIGPSWVMHIGDSDTIEERVFERAKIVIGGASRPALEVFESAEKFWRDFLK